MCSNRATTALAASTCSFSMSLPCRVHTPLFAASATANVRIISLACRISFSDGEKTRLAMSTCFGWMRDLPSNPSSLPNLHSFSSNASLPSDKSINTPSIHNLFAARAARTTLLMEYRRGSRLTGTMVAFKSFVRSFDPKTKQSTLSSAARWSTC